MQTKLQQLYSNGAKKEDLAFSLQETAFAMLVEAAERALAHTGKNELVLGGGVACNSRLQEMCQIMCKERIQKTKYFCPEKSLLVDNAAMIAYTGELMFNAGVKEYPDKVEIKPRERTDQVEVVWR
jgi:tRNA A37 threonylcarbamoyltransferase TsaD